MSKQKKRGKNASRSKTQVPSARELDSMFLDLHRMPYSIRDSELQIQAALRPVQIGTRVLATYLDLFPTTDQEARAHLLGRPHQGPDT
jgi:hypothetical protein